MAVCYNNLWKLLIDRNMNKTDLKEAAGISFNVMARMGKNETISFDSIEKICMVLDCNIGDIIEIVKPKKELKKPKTIELFAGAGGLALGIERAGFDTIGLIEFDKDASDTLRANRPEWRVINDDIANISCMDLKEYFNLQKGELDLLSGGAPCQRSRKNSKSRSKPEKPDLMLVFLKKLRDNLLCFTSDIMVLRT